MPDRAILFDLDGTLIDSLADIATAANTVMQTLGQPTHPTQAFRQMVGEGADVLVRRALPEDQQHLADQAHTLFKDYYRNNLVQDTTLYPGIADLLDTLAARDVPMAIVTNKPQFAAEEIAESLLARWAWVAVTGHASDAPKKPDPTGALDAATKAGVAPAACLFVGDSKTDMQTAVAARMMAVGVTWGFRDRDELLAHGADHLIDRPSQLLDLIAQQTPA